MDGLTAISKTAKYFPIPNLPLRRKRSIALKCPPPSPPLPAHGSPLGLEYFDSSAQDPALRNYFLVALHGSSHKRLKRGYRVVRLSANSGPQDFITGFLQNGVVYGRPCDIFRIAPDSFLLTDDLSGVIYYLHRK
jgi:glucose/arabinose dehydrogenase